MSFKEISDIIILTLGIFALLLFCFYFYMLFSLVSGDLEDSEKANKNED